MKPEEIIDLVESMREWQKRYFRERSAEALSRSKELERRVDAAIEQFKNRQPGLF